MSRIDVSKRIQKQRTFDEMREAVKTLLHQTHNLHVPRDDGDPDVVLYDAIRELMDLRARFEGMTRYQGAGNGTEEALSPEQQRAAHELRYRMCEHMVAEVDAFYTMHPELRLMWRFECSAQVREKEEKQREMENEQMTAEELHAIGVVSALKELRVAIHTNIKDAKSFADRFIQRGPGGRELALAITNLQQARMWVSEALGEVGHKLPEAYRDEANGER